MPEYDERTLRHIYLTDHGESESFTSPMSSGGPEAVPARNRGQHAAALERALRTRADAPWFFVLFVFIALLGRSVRYGADLYKNLYPFSFIKYYVPGVCLYTAALIASWWKSTRGQVFWKGRSYPAKVHPRA